jgi:hypothetical protein
MKMKAIIGASLLTLALASCSTEEDASSSDPKIGNGETVSVESDETRAIVMVKSRKSDGLFRGHCTGTLLNDTTLITAVHCLTDYDTGGIFVALPDGRHAASVNVFYSPRARQILESVGDLRGRLTPLLKKAFQEDAKCKNSSVHATIGELSRRSGELMSELPRHDVALVVFPSGTGDAITRGRGYYGIAETSPQVGDKMLFVGYGQSATRVVRASDSCGTTLQGDGFGLKRRGSNQIARATGETVVSNGYASREAAAEASVGVGQQVIIRPGDSGGPWVACSGGSCATRRLFAINSTGTFANGNRETGTGKLVTSKSTQALFARAINCQESPCAANFAGSGVRD